MATAAELTGEEIAAVAESLSDPANLNVDTMAAIMHRIGPGLMALGQKVLVALIIFLIGRKIISMIEKMLSRSMEHAGMDVGVTRFLRALTQFVMNVFLLFMIAGQLGMDSASIVAVLGAAGLALSLALQQSLGNFAGGLLILIMKPFRVGDYIISPSGEGRVSMVGLVYTTILTTDNKAITIPNGTLSNSTVTNVTAMDKRMLELKVGIAYEADIRTAKAVLERVYREHPMVKKDEDIKVFVDSLGDSSVVLGIRGWVETSDYWQTRWDILERIKLSFDEAGIEIPYNKMDIHLKQ